MFFVAPHSTPVRAGILICLIGSALLASAGETRAATVRVELFDENDLPLRHTELRLVPEQPPVNDVRWWSDHAIRATTDDVGVALFHEVPSGRHTITAGRWTRDFVRPEENPLAPPLKLTVTGDDAVVPVRFVLHRGTPLFARFFIDGSTRRLSTTLAMFEHENGHHAGTRIFRGDETIYPLIAGRWDIRLVSLPGYLLERVEVDGEPIDGHIASFEVRTGAPAVFVTWTFRAPATLSGHVYFKRDSFPVQVRASLVEPGPWIDAVQARGGSEFELVGASVDPRDGSYSMDLPDGRWLVAPAGADLVSAEPPGSDLVLAVGEDAQLDFEVDGEKSSGSFIEVRVHKPRGGVAEGAVVELWPRDASQRGDVPLASGKTSRWGFAMLEGVTAGDYTLAAAHPDYLENWIDLEFDPDADDRPISPLITLEESAQLEILVEGLAGIVPQGTRFRMQRLDGRPTRIILDPEIVRAAMQPEGEADATGRVVLRGIYSGTFGVIGGTESAFVRFDEDGSWRESIERTFVAPERQEAVARLFPAGTISGGAFCENGSELPGNLDIHVVPRGTMPSDPRDESWQEQSVLAAADVSLGGNAGGRFEIGPLEAGAYLVAVRPATFERWTWAFGTEDGGDAGSLEIADGGSVDLGAIPIDCGPAARIVPIVVSGAGVPDMRDVRRKSFEIAGSVTTADGDVFHVDDAALQRLEKLVVVRDLREGDADLQVALGHRYFLPDYWVQLPVRGELARGSLTDVVLELADVGGSVSLRYPDAVLARLVSGEGLERVAAFGDGSARIDNVPEATYRLDLCRDPECHTLLRTWDRLVVTRLETTTVTPNDERD